MDRSEARKHIFSLIFQFPFYDEFQLDEAYRQYFLSVEVEPKKMQDFIYSVYSGTFQNLEEIDKLISENIKGWSFKRLNRDVLAILRMATYELLYQKDTPDKVVINEAVALSKIYCDEDSYKFVNGTLGTINKNLGTKNDG